MLLMFSSEDNFKKVSSLLQREDKGAAVNATFMEMLVNCCGRLFL